MRKEIATSPVAETMRILSADQRWLALHQGEYAIFSETGDFHGIATSLKDWLQFFKRPSQPVLIARQPSHAKLDSVYTSGDQSR